MDVINILNKSSNNTVLNCTHLVLTCNTLGTPLGRTFPRLKNSLFTVLNYSNWPFSFIPCGHSSDKLFKREVFIDQLIFYESLTIKYSLPLQRRKKVSKIGEAQKFILPESSKNFLPHACRGALVLKS